MLTVETLTVGQLQTNCYIVYSSDPERTAAIIDPGDDAEYIMNRIADLNVTPSEIIATHGHFDHIGAVSELMVNYQVPFLMNSADTFLVTRMRQTAKHFTSVDLGPAPVVTGDPTDSAFFMAFATPGHTPGAVMLLAKKEGIAFVGDTLFADGAFGDTTHSYSDKKALGKSVQLICSLPGDTLLYPGHGDPILVEDIQRYIRQQT